MNGRAPHLDSKIESDKINRVQSHGEQHPVHKYGGRGGLCPVWEDHRKAETGR